MPWQSVGSPYVVISPTNGVLLVYGSPGPGTGTLVASIAAVAGTDQYGNQYVAGISQYITQFGQLYAVTLNEQSLEFGYPGMFVTAVGANAPYDGAGIAALSSNTIATTLITSGTTTSLDHAAYIDLTSGLSTVNPNGAIDMEAGIITALNGPIEIVGQVIQPGSGGSVFGMDPLDMPAVVAARDTQLYQIGHKIVQLSAQVLVNSTSAVGIVSFPINDDSILYRIQGVMLYVGSGAAGTPIFGWGGSATYALIGTERYSNNGGVSVTFNGAQGDYTGPALAANLQTFEFDFLVEASSTGTVLLYGKEGVAGDSFNVKAMSYIIIQPCS